MRMKRFALIAVCAVLIAGILCGCNMPSINLTTTTTPSEDLMYFFECLAKEDYAAAEEYVYNFSSLGFVQDSGDELDRRLSKLLTQSRSVRIVSEGEVYGKDSTVTIELTTLDFKKLETALSEKVVEEIKARQFVGQTFETEEEILAVVYEILDSMTVSMSDYYSTKQFDVDMKLSDNHWKIVCSEELYSAIIGYAI